MNSYQKLKERIKGVVVVMVTPFLENSEIDEKGLRKLTRFLVESGIREGQGVLVPTGSTGECPMLSAEERKEIFAIVKEEAGNEVPVLGGCNHCDTREVIKMVHYAEEVGLDGVMISPPYYWKPNEQILLNHFKAVAQESGLGIMVYNNWFASQWDIPVETVEKLVEEVPSVVALKENTPFIAKFAEMARKLGGRIAIINGAGEPHEPYAGLMGARGFVSGIACVIPQTCLAIYQAESSGDFFKAKEIVDCIAPLVGFFVKGNHDADYILRIKAVMNLLGLPGGLPRLPLLPASQETAREGLKILERLDLKEIWSVERKA